MKIASIVEPKSQEWATEKPVGREEPLALWPFHVIPQGGPFYAPHEQQLAPVKQFVIEKYWGTFATNLAFETLPAVPLGPRTLTQMDAETDESLASTPPYWRGATSGWFLWMYPGQGPTTESKGLVADDYQTEVDSFRRHSELWHWTGQFDPVQTMSAVDTDSLRSTFRRLVDQWRSETMMLSSLPALALDSSYQRIIGLGSPVLPLLLEELRDSPHQWFWALVAIAGEDPAAGTTDFETARQLWLDWGRKRNLIE
jgi:hypothetical protein